MTHGPILLLLQLRETVGQIGMQIFNFVVVSVIIAHHIVLTLHINKTCLLISSLDESDFELN